MGTINASAFHHSGVGAIVKTSESVEMDESFTRKSSPLAGFQRHTENLRTNDRCWGFNRFVGDFLEPSMFKLDPGFAIGVAAIAQSLPKGCYQILNAPHASPPRRSDMLDKHESAPRFENAQYLSKAALLTRNAAQD